MEFWGLEVKPGQSVKVAPEDDHFLHLSQGALGEVKKDEKATMFVKVEDQKLAIGTLSNDKFPQIQFDLVFEKEFELSHTSKSSSVFFSGYKVFQPADGEEMDFDDSEGDSEEEEEAPKLVPATKENGKAEAKDKEAKQVKIAAPAKADAKPKADAKAVAGKGKKESDSDDSDESDDSDSDDDSEGQLIPINDSDDDSMGDSDESSDDEDDESDDSEEDEETPKKAESGKKRAAESSSVKTPAASDKKAKIAATPSGHKTGEKKGAAVHVATPHPAKKAGKTPATTDKSPKSGGSVACKSCTKTFSSENGLIAHTNAKHKAPAAAK